MENDCPAVYEANGSLPREECIAALLDLPVLTPTNNFDGNDYGCRCLHTVLTIQNEFHCPHISLIPLEDDEGQIKCYKSKQISEEDLFTPEELNLFDQVLERNGVDTSIGYLLRER